jgi:hypothetical protein
MKLVKDWMSNDFKLIKGNISPLKAIALLENSPYGVVENVNQQAIGVVTGTELEKVIAANETVTIEQLLSKAPLLRVGCDVEMLTVETSPQLVMLIKIAKAAIVTDYADQIVGILSADAIRQFIQKSSGQQKGTILGGDTPPYVAGSALGGALSPLTAYCICNECWHDNKLSAEQLNSLQASPPEPLTCQNPDPTVPRHLIKLS